MTEEFKAPKKTIAFTNEYDQDQEQKCYKDLVFCGQLSVGYGRQERGNVCAASRCYARLQTQCNREAVMI